ncbi:MAG: hypothetical protein IPM56_16255 [Ignavibacteriales bacterium]|nr:MAG: hypothetical protein IPM56_16255 [Ignavibacteriales bacterium]
MKHAYKFFAILFLFFTHLLLAQTDTVYYDLNFTGGKIDTLLNNIDQGIMPVNSISFSEMNTIATGNLLGRNTAGTGDIEVLSPSTIRTLLGLVVGTNVQAYDADLTTYAGITPSANVQTLLGAADYSAVRTQLSLTIGTNVQAYDADLTTWAGITPSANVQSLLGAADYSGMRTLLSLVPGTNVQAFDSDLSTIAGLTATTDNFIVSVSSAWASRTPSQVRTTLGLVIGTNVQAYDADLTTYAGITPSANVQTLLGSADYSAFKTSLSLNNVTNESKATMFNSPTFTGVATFAATLSPAVGLGTVTTAIDWSQGNSFTATLTDAREFTFSNVGDGQVIQLLILRTDGELATFNNANLEWPEDTPPSNGTGNGRDIYTFWATGGKIYGWLTPFIARTW